MAQVARDHTENLCPHEGFSEGRMYSLTDQLRRSVSSIPANIAEGCGRNGKNDFGRFLNIALGSANETEYFLLLSKDLQYLHLGEHRQLERSINEVKAMLISLIQKVRV